MSDAQQGHWANLKAAAKKTKMSTKWEYRVKFIKIPRHEATASVTGELNEVGEGGWELVSVVTVATMLMAVFKRPGGTDGAD